MTHISTSFTIDAQPLAAWGDCRFLSCSVLPVRVACNLTCPFCFSKSSLQHSATSQGRGTWAKSPITTVLRATEGQTDWL